MNVRSLVAALGRRWRSSRRRRNSDSIWFWDHYEAAPDEIVEFLGGAGISARDLSVADVGCGDGIMALGLATRVYPARLVGFDVNPVDVDELLRRARAERAVDSLPPELTFAVCTATELPAPAASFDLVYTWSAFEHVSDPARVLAEINRVLRPEGVLLLQLWPFYFSEHGSHLWDWFSEPFYHLQTPDDQLVAEIADSSVGTESWKHYMIMEFGKLNRITLGDLQDALLAARFDIVRFELLTHRVALAPEFPRSFRLADLGVAGVKLLARPRPPASEGRQAPVPREVTKSERER